MKPQFSLLKYMYYTPVLLLYFRTIFTCILVEPISNDGMDSQMIFSESVNQCSPLSMSHNETMFGGGTIKYYHVMVFIKGDH